MGDLEVWGKPLISTMSGKVAVALLNRSDKEQFIGFDLSTVSINPDKPFIVRNLWNKKEQTYNGQKELQFKVPAHGVVAIKIEGTSLPYNVFQFENQQKVKPII